MSIELHYFDTNGLGEYIRYVLHYTKQEFKDVRHDYDNWATEKSKISPPFGKLPLYKEGERVLNQSIAICKYVARNTDLVPTDAWEQAVLDSIVYTINDYWADVVASFKQTDPEKQKEMVKKIKEETIDYYFSRFEKRLEENNGYFVGKLSWAEFVYCGLIEATDLFLGTDLEKRFPCTQAVIEKIRNSPGVKEYIAGRKDYKWP